MKRIAWRRIAGRALACIVPWLVLGLPGALPQARAQDYPNRPIRLVIGYAPGGLGDLLSRLIADRMSARMKQPVLVENRVGAGGTIAAGLVAKAPPDGYTLLQGTAAEITYASSVHGAKLAYDPAKDLAPITMLNLSAMALVAHPGRGLNSVKELIDFARANPGRLNIASFGNGSSSHFAAEMFKASNGLDIQHVPYKGSGPAVQELMAGRVDILFDTVASSAQHARSGKLVPLAVTSPQRAAPLPQVPTFRELGIGGVELQPWAALFAPAGTPEAIIQRLNREVRDILALPEVSERLASLAAGGTPSSPEELGAHVRAEIARIAKVVNEAKLKFD